MEPNIFAAQYFCVAPSYLRSMIVSKISHIGKWTSWYNTFGWACYSFERMYRKKPNGIQASMHTFEQIYFLLNNIPGTHKSLRGINEDGETVTFNEDDYLQIDCIRYKGQFVYFYQDNDLKSGEFRVLYVDDDDDGKEEDFTPKQPDNDREVISSKTERVTEDSY